MAIRRQPKLVLAQTPVFRFVVDSLEESTMNGTDEVRAFRSVARESADLIDDCVDGVRLCVSSTGGRRRVLLCGPVVVVVGRDETRLDGVAQRLTGTCRQVDEHALSLVHDPATTSLQTHNKTTSNQLRR